jgi:DNA-binding response OmpR family regulator
MSVLQHLNEWFSRFPLRKGNPTILADGTQERRTQRRQNPRSGLRVLIIDDCERALREVGEMFASLGYVVLQSSQPERGLRMARFEKPDLVILDIGMPGMNGFEVLRLMRKDPLARRLPVIMMSGNPRAVEMFQQMRIEADGFLRKPFSRRAIFENIEALLDDDMIPRRLNALKTDYPRSLIKRLSRKFSGA